MRWTVTMWRWIQRWFYRAPTVTKTDATVVALRRTADQKSKQVIEQLREKKFGELRLQFHPLLRWFLSETLLRKGLDLISLTAGPLVDAGKPQISTGWLITTAAVPVQFKNIKLALLLSMTTSGQIIGLKFGPQTKTGLIPAWRSPSYADPAQFREKEIRIGTKYKVKAMLTVPTVPGAHPCIVMIGGSGPCDMDSTVECLKPFKDLAWGLASQGIATIRFDKVTVDHGRKLDNKTITLSDEYDDQATDAVRYVRSAPEIDKNRIFVLGHSLGAFVAPDLITRDPSIAGLLIMAGPAQSVYRSAIQQMKYLSDQDTASPNEELLKLEQQAKVADALEAGSTVPASELPFGIGAAYWISVRPSKPLEQTRLLQKPVMIMQGVRDYQVSMDDFSKWRHMLVGHENVEFRVYEKLNHLFVAGEGLSTPMEYSNPGHVGNEVIKDISNWIKAKAPMLT